MLQIINHNIWFFIFHLIEIKRLDDTLYEFKIKKNKKVFGCYFIDEKLQIQEIQFENQIIVDAKLEQKEKVIDFFNDVMGKEQQQQQILKKIEPDKIAKISLDYLAKNPNNYFIYLNNNFENLLLRGTIPEKVIIMKEKNFAHQFKKMLKKYNRK
ncbi:MAG: hypothetical protein HPPSJP_1040 [Candidatus Hepatoplasma scabrum]|nr:MAG: hypothetical protein HPPSJP_1040 [Candidatus Hepatoplasma sp.]